MQNGGFEPDKTSSKWNKQVEEKRVTKSSYDWFRIAHYSDKKKIKYKNCEPEIFYLALLHCSWNLPGAEMALVCEMEEWTGPSGEKAWLFFYRKSLIRSISEIYATPHTAINSASPLLIQKGTWAKKKFFSSPSNLFFFFLIIFFDSSQFHFEH